MLTNCCQEKRAEDSLLAHTSSSANSSAVTAGCSEGAFLPYHAHIAIRPSAGNAGQKSACCHPRVAMSVATSGGVIADASCNPMTWRPCTSAHCLDGNQDSMTPELTGNTGP